MFTKCGVYDIIYTIMIIKLMKKLSKTQVYFVVAIGIPLYCLLLYILGSTFGAFGAMALLAITMGFVIAEAWMDCTD